MRTVEVLTKALQIEISEHMRMSEHISEGEADEGEISG